MITANSLLPEQMTAEQRCLEIASLLAAGLCRLRDRNSHIYSHQLIERQVLLGFQTKESVHSQLASSQGVAA